MPILVQSSYLFNLLFLRFHFDVCMSDINTSLLARSCFCGSEISHFSPVVFWQVFSPIFYSCHILQASQMTILFESFFFCPPYFKRNHFENWKWCLVKWCGYMTQYIYWLCKQNYYFFQVDENWTWLRGYFFFFCVTFLLFSSSKPTKRWNDSAKNMFLNTYNLEVRNIYYKSREDCIISKLPK